MKDIIKLLSQGKKIQQRAMHKLPPWSTQNMINISQPQAIIDIENKTPFLTDKGDLIIPKDCDSKYHWWSNGQSILDTLIELKANEDVLDKYVGQWRTKISKNKLN